MKQQQEPAVEANPWWHLHRLRVRYQETDQMGVVYHGNYANWFEIGRTELIRYGGMPYRTVEEQKLLLPVVELNCTFKQPAKYDDEVIVCTMIAQFTHIRLSFRSQVRRIAEGASLPPIWRGAEPPGELLVEGGTRHVWVNEAFKPARIDKQAPELYRLLAELARGREGKEES